MQTRNKIGFYLSGDHMPAALSDWMVRLDEADIPFFLTVDAPGAALEQAQAITRASDASHTVVYRNLAGPQEPDYRRLPEEAAAAYWQAQQRTLPAQFDKDTTWLAPMVITKTTEQWGDWLGVFAYELGQQMLSDGFKLAALGFPVGTPELRLWQRDAMQRFLLLCARHPDRLGVALQEFSRQPEDIWFRRDDHIGRFFRLFAACDRAGIDRPTLLISHWGWTPERIPSGEDRALAGIAEVSRHYAQFPQIRGAALWRITPEDLGIGWQTRRVIRPLTDWTLATMLDVEESVAPDTTLLESVGPANARFISDVTVPDDTRIVAGQNFTKTWRVRNSGGVAWGSGFTLRHVGGLTLGAKSSQPLPPAQPGEVVDISVAMTAPVETGVAFSDWRLHDKVGHVFGDVVYTRIEVIAQPDPVGGVLSSQFVADVTIPDDMEIEPGQALVKTWRVRNNGTKPWGAGFTLGFVGGNMVAPAAAVPVPSTAPGDEADVSMPIVAPAAPGVYYADFRLRNAQGQTFGDMMYVRFIVPQPVGGSLAMPLSQRDPLWAGRLLGEVGSTKTIGEWGCLLVVMAMTARALKKDTDPIRMQDDLLANNGFMDLNLTRWDALSQVYGDVVFGGYVLSSSELMDRINASLAAGVPVPIQVDFTRDTPYTDFDQHWVLIVGRDGDDYRINDPWLLPAQEASLMERYGKAGLSLRESIIAAIFYRLVGVPRPDEDEGGPPDGRPTTGLLERGMNVNPDAPFSNPYETDDLKGLEWVRFVFKIAARPNAAERGDIQAAFRQYDPIVQAYNQMGIKCLIVLNQETVWGVGPWTGNNDWRTYADQLAATAGEIAAHYRRYGDRVAYQIWNEGDKKNNPASVYVTPEDYAEISGPVGGGNSLVSAPGTDHFQWHGHRAAGNGGVCQTLPGSPGRLAAGRCPGRPSLHALGDARTVRLGPALRHVG